MSEMDDLREALHNLGRALIEPFRPIAEWILDRPWAFYGLLFIVGVYVIAAVWMGAR